MVILRQDMIDIRYTYALVDPRTFEIRYIGITKHSDMRLTEHIRIAKNDTDSNIHKRSWIKQLLKLDLKPIFVILESCPIEDSSNSEIWWISLCKSLGFNLTNLTNGGDFPPSWEGKKHSEETKKKQSKSIGEYYSTHIHPMKGKSPPPEWSINNAESRKKKGILNTNWTYFVSSKRVKDVYGKRSENEEWKNKLREASKQRLSDPTKNPMYGKEQSESSKEKNRLSNLMYGAYKREEYLSLTEIQEDYFEAAGKYQPDYAEFSYQSF